MDGNSCHRKLMEYNPVDGDHQGCFSLMDGVWERIYVRIDTLLTTSGSGRTKGGDFTNPEGQEILDPPAKKAVQFRRCKNHPNSR